MVEDSSVRVAFVVRFHILLCDRSTEMVLTLCGPNLSSLQRGFSTNNSFKMANIFLLRHKKMKLLTQVYQ